MRRGIVLFSSLLGLAPLADSANGTKSGAAKAVLSKAVKLAKKEAAVHHEAAKHNEHHEGLFLISDAHPLPKQAAHRHGGSFFIVNANNTERSHHDRLQSFKDKFRRHFLIQSVREDHAVLLEEYEQNRLQAEEFCQPASTFVSATGTKHEYMESMEREVKGSFSETRQFVQSAEFATRRDDVRRALDMRELWENSIVLEMERVVSVIEKQKKSAVAHGQDVGEVLGNERHDLHEHLAKSPDGKFHKSFEDEKLGSVKSHKAPYGGSEQNSPQAWGDQKQHYETAAKFLEEIAKIISVKISDSQTLFVNHVSQIVSDADFELKWPSDFTLGGEVSSAPVTAADALKILVNEESSQLVNEFVSSERGNGNAVVGAHIDTYKGEEASNDANLLVEAIKNGKIDTFWNKGGSPSRALSQLTIALNSLQIRRLGYIDARSAIMKLVVDIQSQMEALSEQVSSAVVSIATGLKENEETLVYTYRDAIGFEGVTLDSKIGDKGAALDGFQKHLDELNSAYQSGDSLKSMVPRISFIVNAARALHRELISFVVAHSQLVEHSEISDKVTGFETGDLASVYANIRTMILDTPKTVRNWIDNPQTENIEQTTADQLSQEEQLARTTALCLLYGRIDGLEEHKVHEGGAQEEQLCGPSYEFGEAVSEKIGEVYPQAEPEEVEHAHSPKLTIDHSETTETSEHSSA